MSDGLRSPIPGVELPGRVECLHDECVLHREIAGHEYATALKDDPKATAKRFECPNRKDPRTASKCPTRGFLYPRVPRKPAGDKFDPEVDFHFHQGIDILGDDGITEIHSITAGVVVHARRDYDPGYKGYGRALVIKGDDGLFYLYAHCYDFKVREGERVAAGQAVAIMGCTAFDTPQDAVDELAHCEAVGLALSKGEAPPKPPEVKYKGKDGKEYKKKWTAPHLHFEVSETGFPKPRADERRPEKPYNPRQRLNPLEVLAGLGRSDGAAPKLCLPNGQRVTPKTSEALFRSIEDRPLGGYFPIGANNFWHGGVHLFGALGDEVVAPFDATIVAARLDENPDTTNQDFGSTNFVLLRHTIPQSVVSQLAPIAPQPEKPGDKPVKQAAGTISVGKSERSKETPNPATNKPAEYVKEAKRRLRACPRPGTNPPEPFYPGSEEDLESGDMDEKLVKAIHDFQALVVGIKNPDSVMSMVPERRTYAALRALTPSISAVADGPDGTSRGSAEPSDAGAASADGTPVYSLFMHLEPCPIDLTRAQKVPWLARARSRRSVEDPEERREAEYAMDGDVGPTSARGMENYEKDVRWVQQRLLRFGYFQGRVNGLFDEKLEQAIERFQAEHSMKNDKLDSKARKVPDRIVSRNGNTYRWLKKTPSEIAGGGIDAAFLQDLRARADDGTCKVVSGLNVPVSAGEALGTMGYGGGPTETGLLPLLHWEIFSEAELMESWHPIDDTSDGLTIDATDPIVSAVEHLAETGADDGKLTTDEVVRYYNSGLGANLRHTRCRFRNEWSHDADEVEKAFAALGDPLAEFVREEVKPYLWWTDAADAVPATPTVWHYNPIAFLTEYARATGGFAGSLSVIVKHEGRAVGGAVVKVSSPGQKERTSKTSADGMAALTELAPGLYEVVAAIERPSPTSSEGLSAEARVTVEPAEDAVITLELG